ncbi:uncharacterized protein [Amphiura filiformis]|uniref:uncharacterized protein n=1 Tax=Amphiura filiformis TaxID=82378 RepID=UPI003B222291
MGSKSSDNFMTCIAAIQALLEHVLPSLQHAIDTWHYQTKQTIQLCATPNQCPQNKKPSTKNKACQGCIDWVTDIEAQVYPSFGSLQWTNVNPTLFNKDPLEVIKLFVLRIPAKKTFSILADFDAASLLMIMSKFKGFHGGDQSVFEQIMKVFAIRNMLAHFEVRNKLQLDDTTFNAFWKDITDLVDGLESLGRQYFTPQKADELRKKLIEIKTHVTPYTQVHIDKDTVQPIVKDIILQMKQEETLQTNKESLSGSRSGDVELCQVHGCTEEVFVACPDCMGFLCQRHFVEDSPCEQHTIEQADCADVQPDAVSPHTELANEPLVSGNQTRADEDIRESDKEALSDDLVQSIAADLRNYYQNNYCKKQMYPWQPGNYVELDSIYVPVTIDITIPGMRPIKERLKSYQEIFESEEDARYILTGSPGQGKSTFCSKLAFDWCQQSSLSPLKDVQLLFIIQLATLKHSSNIEDVICSQLLSSNVDSSTLRKVIHTLGKEVVIVLDGLDEAPPDLFKHEINGNLVDIIRFKQYRECCVLVTTRPWREKEITSEIPVYRRLELQKMKRSDVRAYVKKLFGQNPTDLTTITLGKSLLQYIDKNKLLLDTSTPLMVLLISWYWIATNGKKGIPDRISEFYDEIVTIMYDNFMKSTSDENTQSAQELKEQPSLVDRILTSTFGLLPTTFSRSNVMSQKEMLYSYLGELAVNGLTPTTTKIVFTEDEVKKLCGQKYLDQARGMGILCRRGEHALQFFHKSGQEFCAGNYLQNNPRKVASYLQNVNTVKDALSIAPVLIFASRSKPAAKLIMQKLLSIFESEIPAQKYYDEQLSFDDSRPIQQYIELCLECNFEADAKAEFVSTFKSLFVDGKILFLGISSKTTLALAYFMSYCDPGAISDITLCPIAIVSDPDVFGPSLEIFYDSLRRMKYLPKDKIQQMRESSLYSMHPGI